jgi:predicted dehydrogenase
VAGAATSFEERHAHENVEAVYIATPHSAHEAHAVQAIRAGKHVLCEKPLAMSEAATQRVIGEAQSAGVFLMEAFMYRSHPMMVEVAGRLADGIIGPLRHMRADFGFRQPRDRQGRLFDPKLGGGGILDVGGYPVSLARLVAGLAEGHPFAEPVRFSAAGHVGPSGVDEIASALLTFSSGLTAALTCAVHHDVGTSAVIFGDEGKLVLGNPWVPHGDRQSLESSYTIERGEGRTETFVVRTKLSTYALEAELVADSLPATEPAWPAMSWDDTLGNMRLLDAWRAALTPR